MAGHDIITGAGKIFFQAINDLDNLECRIGYQAGEAVSEQGFDYVDIAAKNEFGSGNVPSRPFLRMSVDDNEQEIDAFCKTQLQRLSAGATAQEILEACGVFQKGLVQKKIVDGPFTPNAPATIKRKGSSKPLIDTGRMRQSVNFVIKKKGV